MAKKKFDPATFVSELIDGVDGLTDEQKTNLTSLITGNEKLSVKLGESVMRQSDYSREIAKLQEQNQSVMDYKTQLEEWKQTNEQVVLNAKAEAEAYKQRLIQEGVIHQSTATVPPREDAFTKKDWERYSAELQNQGVNVMAKLTKLAVSHYNKYKEELDTDALVQESTKNGLPLDVAYDRLKAPFEDKLREKQFEQKLKEAKEEGQREAFAKAGFPSEAGLMRDTMHPLDYADSMASKPPNGEAPKVGWKAAAEAHIADYKSGKLQSTS